jgi:ribosomal peptide maturation radical SAM protein 1
MSAPPSARPAGRTATPAERAALPVVVITMPFMAVDRPSIQVGLLTALAADRGFPVRGLHANLDFAVRVGLADYELLNERRGRMVGDWLFSVAAFGAEAPDTAGSFPEVFEPDLGYLAAEPGQMRRRLLEWRDVVVPAYLDELVEEIAASGVRVAAFSSTFQQNTASFALAERLKRRVPGLVTVFGGANFDGEMGLELVRSVDAIDLAVIGEGDRAFPDLLDALAAGADPGAVPGVARRDGDTVAATPPAPALTRLDDLPDPDYTEYFSRAQRLGVLSGAGHRTIWIPFEAARGCWWGAKHHCTFCGLNGATMTFRSKTPERIQDELARQVRRYRSFSFEAVDNIMDRGYLRTLLPRLAGSGAGYEMFYEVKANLSRQQVKQLALGGVNRIQPGIESLSSRVLSLMRKGVTAAQNVNLLRWARYYGIDVAWNLLYGFPGETAQDYAEQATAAADLVHLQPPGGAGRIWLERFSPLFTEHETFGLRWRRPERSYGYVYPERVDLDRVAYFFEYELADALPDEAYAPLVAAVDDWTTRWAVPDADRPVLRYWSAPGYLQLYDNRRPGAEGTYTFAGLLADIYLACVDRPISAAAVRARVGAERPVEEIEEALVEFHRRGLMFLDRGRALALALPAVPGR